MDTQERPPEYSTQQVRIVDDGLSIVVVVGLVNAALYLIFVFAGGLYFGDRMAWSLAIASAGLGYLSAFVQASFQAPDPFSLPGLASASLVVACILAGLAGGISLIL